VATENLRRNEYVNRYTYGIVAIWLFIISVAIIVAILGLVALCITNGTTGDLAIKLTKPTYSLLDCLQFGGYFLTTILSLMIASTWVVWIIAKRVKKPTTETNERKRKENYNEPPETPPFDQ
jgi:large-conductance mechanosensitive channel